jgi:hypothetical protein
MIADSGCLRALPKLLSMRRKGGFAAQADPLDKPGESAIYCIIRGNILIQ